MRCMVTGAAGFVGSHLCERLIEDGHTVLGVDDLSNGKRSNLDSLRTNHRFHFVESSVCSPEMFEIMPGIDWCFHLAAKADIVPSIENPSIYHHANVNGTFNTLEAARKARVKKFIYAASSSCYGIPLKYPTKESASCIPLYPYALTKYLGEQYVSHWGSTYKMNTVSLRLFNVYGPRHRTSGAYGAVFGTFLAQLANGKPVTVVGDGTQTRDFTYVTDVCNAFIRAALQPVNGYLNIGSGGTYSINDLVKNLGATDIVYLPKRPKEPDVTFADIFWANNLLGWAPTVSFDEGCKRMKAMIPKYKDAPVWTKESIDKATKSWFEYLGG